MTLQYNQGCYMIDWMGRPYMFVRCIACLYLDKDCRHLRTIQLLMLIHADETKRIFTISDRRNRSFVCSD
jgi:hypothetical protein